MIDHAELRRVAEAATPGPWQVQGAGSLFGEAYERNAEFTAAANPAVVLALLDEIDRLRADLDRLVPPVLAPARDGNGTP